MIDMNTTIEKQQLIAEELLHILEGADPHVILAGGAPRDWYFNKLANDLDFYVYLQPATQCFENLRWKSLGLDLEHIGREVSGETGDYECMEHLSRVYEGLYKGQKYQVMVMRKSTFDCVVSNFGCSVCMAWWKGINGGVRVTEQFLLSHATKTLFIKDDYTAKVVHVAKMQERYPNYTTKSFKYYDSARIAFQRKYDCYDITNKAKEILCKMIY
jgi:hypothetical protein